MIGFSLLGSGNSTTNAATYATNTYNITSGSLLLAFVHNTKASAPDTPLYSGNRMTWTNIGTITFNTTGTPTERLTVFRAYSTGTFANGISTGSFSAATQTSCTQFVCQFTGLNTGSVSGSPFGIVQITSGRADTTANPSITMNTITGINNAVVACFGNNSNPFGGTQAGNYTVIRDVGINAPANGSCLIWNGQNAVSPASVTAASSNWAGFALELNSLDKTITLINNIRRRIFLFN